MKGLFVAFLVGVLFGMGLLISGMANPAKVIGFLDLAGSWDPSLMFVMAGAVGVHSLLAPLVLRRRRPLFAEAFAMPKSRQIDRDLVAGAAIFGVGWGLAGYCPGPALVSLASRSSSVFAFVASMTAGMVLYRLVRPAERAVAEPAVLPGAGPAQ